VQLTEEEIKALATRGFINPAWFLRFFLTKWYPTPMPWVHYGIIAILTRRTDFLLEFGFEVSGVKETYDAAALEKIIKNFVWKEDPSNPDSPEHPVFIAKRDEAGSIIALDLVVGKYTLIMMPRGMSKTTVLNGINIWFTVYQECKFPVYVSKTGKHATKQLSSITKQFVNNTLLKTVFGELKPPQRNDEGFRWSESEGFVQTSSGVTLAAVGAEGQIRGMLNDGQRPDRLNIDDIEDKENTRTAERRDTTREWFFGDLLPVLPELDPNATATMLCNLVNPDSIGVRLMQDPSWTVIKFGPMDKDNEPLWPALLDHDKLEVKKKSYALQGKLAVFYLEYYNEVRNVDDSKFHPHFFIHRPIAPSDIIKKAIVLDPAISEDIKSDYASIAAVGITNFGGFHVMDMWGKVQAQPDEQIAIYFEMVLRLGFASSDLFGVETVAFQASLVSTMKTEMFRRKFYFEIQRITHSQNKIERVEGVLQPRYASGFITHQRPFPELETQLLDWPRGKKDFPDAEAMAIALLDPYAPLTAAGTDGKDLAEDSYEPLSMEFGGDWRQH
jgi:hypothetical protein